MTKSGFCNSINKLATHETCPGSFHSGWWCDCWCHGSRQKVDAELAEMAKELGIDLADLQGGVTEPAISPPSVPVASPLAKPWGNPLPITGEDPVGEPVAGKRPEFRPTNSGRKARGELEYKVYDVCMDWVTGEDFSAIVQLTPKMISESIQKEYGGALPSVGAIGAVFNRWTDKGYAEQASKPVRFVRFSEKVQLEGLEVVKERDKRAVKVAASKKKRGER